MKVLLCEDIMKLGYVGDIVDVSNGYARNYLFPQGLAIPLTGANKRRLEVLRQRRAEREAHEFNSMNELAKSVSKLLCLITVKTGEDGKMFGTVTSGLIADQLKTQFDVTLDKKKIHLETPIRALGEYEVELRLHQDVTGKLKVRVESSTPLPAPPAPAPAEVKKEEHPRTEKRGRRPEPAHGKVEGAHPKAEAGEKKPYGPRPERPSRPYRPHRPERAHGPEKAPAAEKAPSVEKAPSTEKSPKPPKAE